MPTIIQGNKDNRMQASMISKEYDYEYPDGYNFHPSSKLTKLIVDEILDRAYQSSTEMAKRHPSWQHMDDVLTAYIPLDDQEKKVISDDPRKPVSVIFPYTYAIKETLLTYAMSALVQDPIFQYAGTGPEEAPRDYY